MVRAYSRIYIHVLFVHNAITVKDGVLHNTPAWGTTSSRLLKLLFKTSIITGMVYIVPQGYMLTANCFRFQVTSLHYVNNNTLQQIVASSGIART